MYHVLFTHSSVGGDLGGFRLLAIVSRAATNLHVVVCLFNLCPGVWDTVVLTKYWLQELLIGGNRGAQLSKVGLGVICLPGRGDG